jgi:hypothetical protein
MKIYLVSPHSLCSVLMKVYLVSCPLPLFCSHESLSGEFPTPSVLFPWMFVWRVPHSFCSVPMNVYLVSSPLTLFCSHVNLSGEPSLPLFCSHESLSALHWAGDKVLNVWNTFQGTLLLE